MKAQCWRYRVDRRQIAYLKFIVESYDNLALVTTLDPHQGIIELRVPPGCEATVEALMADLGREILIHPMA
ncbi:MAG: DUF4911 domain-containing protein [Desulfosarcinaceae bacterium]|nr:DUF4911 domain-containing protein [Desulfosarcinaceae bacterium]